jgi:hypothetical protein
MAFAVQLVSLREADMIPLLAKAVESKWARIGTLAVALASSGLCSQPAMASQVQAYMLFELDDAFGSGDTIERLRSTSLSNCLQLIIGSHARDVFVHVACDEAGGGGSVDNLNDALGELSAVEGVARATVISVKQIAP